MLQRYNQTFAGQVDYWVPVADDFVPILNMDDFIETVPTPIVLAAVRQESAYAHYDNRDDARDECCLVGSTRSTLPDTQHFIMTMMTISSAMVSGGLDSQELKTTPAGDDGEGIIAL